jgi:hypothetical protein
LGGWPPQEADVIIALSAATWRYIIGQLHRWEELDSLVLASGPNRQRQIVGGLLDA